MTARDAIAGLIEGRNLTENEMAEVMGEVMDGAATAAQIGALLALFRRNGATVDEITVAARAMRARVTPVKVEREVVLDTCGTGGDQQGTFNISTAAALVAAAAGCTVAKHGNRAMSGAVGGADVLEQLGVRIELEPKCAERILDEVGFGFLFAPKFHSAMKHAAGPRRDLGVRTIFNLLGPLTNPAGARHQLLGVFDAVWLEPMAAVLQRLGSVHAMVVHGEDGLDEVSLTAATQVAELRGGGIHQWRLVPEDFGLARCSIDDLQVKSAGQSAAVIRRVLAGEPGPARDVVVLNAGAAIYVADRAPTIAVGMEQARSAIDSGAAKQLLERVARASAESAG